MLTGFIVGVVFTAGWVWLLTLAKRAHQAPTDPERNLRMRNAEELLSCQRGQENTRKPNHEFWWVRNPSRNYHTQNESQDIAASPRNAACDVPDSQRTGSKDPTAYKPLMRTPRSRALELRCGDTLR